MADNHPPYIEQQSLWELYDHEKKYLTDPQGVTWADDNRYSDAVNFPVTTKTIPTLSCPSEVPVRRAASLHNGITHHNYLVNYGNTVYDRIDYAGIKFGGSPFAEKTGWADPHEGFKLADILDGTSNTLMMGEVIQPQGGTGDLRAYSWWRGGATFQGFLGPNSSSPDIMFNAGYCDPPPQFPLNPPCLKVAPTAALPVMQASRSRHVRGVNVNFCDGSGRFILEQHLPHGLACSREQQRRRSDAGGELLANESTIDVRKKLCGDGLTTHQG